MKGRPDQRCRVDRPGAGAAEAGGGDPRAGTGAGGVSRHGRAGGDRRVRAGRRAREEVAVVGNRAGVLDALAVTGGVITSAGVVLAATFATLLVLPVVAALHIGLIVAVGVLLDTFVVRTLLIPAVAVEMVA
jgi:hypothetical protein